MSVVHFITSDFPGFSRSRKQEISHGISHRQLHMYSITAIYLILLCVVFSPAQGGGGRGGGGRGMKHEFESPPSAPVNLF